MPKHHVRKGGTDRSRPGPSPAQPLLQLHNPGHYCLSQELFILRILQRIFRLLVHFPLPATARAVPDQSQEAKGPQYLSSYLPPPRWVLAKS